MQLVVVPDPNLRKECGNPGFPTLDEALQSLKIMQEHRGIGISAPQVGSDKQFFWANDEFVVKPTIIGAAKEMVQVDEGCLSLPGKTFKVLRAPVIAVEYYNIVGMRIRRVLENMPAIVFQHEFDHLFGVMIDEKSRWSSKELVGN